MDEPTVRNPGRQENGQPVRPTMEEERLLDHHIEEVLGAFNDAARLAESSQDGEARQRE